MPTIEPYLRWAGGKSWFRKHLDLIIGDIKFTHYHEPFLGGAAVFFSLDHNYKAYLSDENADLIETYIAVRDNPEEVISYFNGFRNTKEDYYQVREKCFNNSSQRAAQFIYLNQMSYNGLYRVNRSGKYNVPYGFRTNHIYDVEKIRAASKALYNTSLEHGDFEINKCKIKKGDLIFLDPPYTVSHNSNGFIEYNQNLFSLDDQYRLSRYIDYIKDKEAYYILTNAAHTTIQTIFSKGDHMLRLNRYSLIGGKDSQRKQVDELVFTNIPGVQENE